MGKLVDDFLATPIPSEVWHYTSLSGFEGILSSGKLWATEAHYTTDATEFIHAQQIAKQVLEKFQPKDENAARAKAHALEMLNHIFDKGPFSPSMTDVFIASFSTNADLKSQWMEYADAGRGVSLSFDLRSIRPARKLESTVTFAPCIYASEDKERIVQDVFSNWLALTTDLHRESVNEQWAAERIREWNMIDQIYKKPFNMHSLNKNNARYFHTRLHEPIARFLFDFLRIASHCKNKSFYQESEWRLALPHSKSKPPSNITVLYRGANNEVPYVSHNLFAEKLPLVRVEIGPLCNDINQIRDALLQAGYNIPITKSSIPLRTTNSRV